MVANFNKPAEILKAVKIKKYFKRMPIDISTLIFNDNKLFEINLTVLYSTSGPIKPWKYDR